MSTRHVGILAAVAVGLVILMFALETDDTGPAADGGRLLPGLADAAVGLEEIRVQGPGADDDVTLRRDGDAWTVAERDGYPADMATLRQLVLALAEAEIVEAKTADPASYERLGVGDPAEGGSGAKVTLEGGGESYAVILGDPARGDYRYARVAGDARSALIDRNPDLPDDVAGWLEDTLVDIPAGEIRRVRIAHADGETIVIGKDDVEQTDFTVLDIPEGRELQYATVANGIGGALAGLTLDDVRSAPAEPAEPDATTVYETFDGTTVTVTVRAEAGGDDAVSWFSFRAEPDLDGLNARSAGREYRLPAFRENQLTRRWEDLLKAETAPD